MAKTLYLTNAAPSTHRGDNTAKLNTVAAWWTPKKLAEARGADTAGTVTATVTTVGGATNGIEVLSASLPAEWISEPLSADFTISGTITLNLWAAESSNSANAAVNAAIDKIDGATGALTRIATSVRVTEAPLTTPTAANFTVTPTSTACKRGDRLRVRVFADDAGTMGSGFTFTFWFDRSTAAQGESFVTFTETLTFETTAPTGSTYYLTNTTAGFTGAPALLSGFNGADENPLSEGGNWAALNTSGHPMKLVSNAATGTGGLADNYAYWTLTNYGPDVEMYMTITTLSGSVGLVCRVQGEGGANTWDGYQANVSASLVELVVMTNFVRITNNQFSRTWATGDKVGFKVKGSVLQVWRMPSGSSDWGLVASMTDTTYASAGKVAIYASVSTSLIDDVYVATNSNLFASRASTSRGSGAINTGAFGVTGPTSGDLIGEWYTPALAAVSLGGMAKFNIRAFEASTSTNASIKAEIAVTATDGSGATVWGVADIEPSTTGGELPTSDTAVIAWVAGDDVSVTAGQRLRFRLYIDDLATGLVADAANVTVSYNGASAAAAGDTYVTLPVTVTEQATGSTYTKAGHGTENG